MLRQNHGWMTTLGLATMLAGATWMLADHLQARVIEVRQDRMAQGLPLLEFQRLHETGAVLAVDVRDRASYEAGRIAGAVHLALDDLERGEDEIADVRRLARGRLVVTYCSCPTEASSLRAARVLAGRGIPAKALIGGYPKWVEAGGRVEHGYTLGHASRIPPGRVRSEPHIRDRSHPRGLRDPRPVLAQPPLRIDRCTGSTGPSLSGTSSGLSGPACA